MNFERILLCRPQGGLNDVLNRIQQARLYADKFNRTLIVDTNFVNTEYVKDEFSNYFHTADEVLLSIHPIIDRLRDLTAFPNCVAGKLDNYLAHYDQTVENFVERETGQEISFNFRLDYKEQILVYHACGGGPLGVSALTWLRLNEVLSAELIRRLHTINAPYIAIHIRNTDYRTDYTHHLNLLKPRLTALTCNNLFVATDNIECLEYCEALFRSFNIFSFSWLPKIPMRLHEIPDPSKKFEINADAVLDLIMLALSNHLFTMPLARGSATNFSGFSILAHALRSKRLVLRDLVPDVFAKLDFVN